MKNLFSLMNLSRPTAGEVLTVSAISPASGTHLAKNGINFLGFEDWLQVASRGTVDSPHAIFWRKLALQYPEKMAIETLPLLLDAVKSRPNLSDQAKAAIFLISAKKLPLEVIERFVPESEEQFRIKTLLILKKTLGEEKFLPEYLASVIQPRPDGKISFLLENGQPFTCQSNVLTVPIEKKRIFTLFGRATKIAVLEKHSEAVGKIRHFLFLVDGDSHVCKMREAQFNQIIIVAANKSVAVKRA